MTDSPVVPLVVNGWTLFAHPSFLDQAAELAEKVAALKAANPGGYRSKNATKRLAAITKLIFEEIPSDPADPKFRQGNTLGDEHRHWFRAKSPTVTAHSSTSSPTCTNARPPSPTCPTAS